MLKIVIFILSPILIIGCTTTKYTITTEHIQESKIDHEKGIIDNEGVACKIKWE